MRRRSGSVIRFLLAAGQDTEAAPAVPSAQSPDGHPTRTPTPVGDVEHLNGFDVSQWQIREACLTTEAPTRSSCTTPARSTLSTLRRPDPPVDVVGAGSFCDRPCMVGCGGSVER